MSQEPAEIVHGRLAEAAAALLATEMDRVFLSYLAIHDKLPKAHTFDPRLQAAQTANRIVVRSRRLIEDIGRYRRLAWLCEDLDERLRDQEVNATLTDDDEIPF